MRASPNEVPLSAADSSRPLSGLLAPAIPWKSLLVEMYGPRVETTLLCGRQETLPEAQKTILASTWLFAGASCFAV